MVSLHFWGHYVYASQAPGIYKWPVRVLINVAARLIDPPPPPTKTFGLNNLEPGAPLGPLGGLGTFD